jgi:hypothetical protein
MAINSLDDIRAIEDLEVREVEVPAWNETVRLKQLSAADFADMIDRAQQEDGERIMFLLVAYCLVDEKGARIASADDVAVLAGKSKDAIQTLYEAANELTGLFRGEAEKKDSETPPNSDSSTS